jgi:hypothetical protein
LRRRGITVLEGSQDLILVRMAKAAASDQYCRILIFWFVAKCIIWESNFGGFCSKGNNSDEFKPGGKPEKQALAARNMGTVSD